MGSLVGILEGIKIRLVGGVVVSVEDEEDREGENKEWKEKEEGEEIVEIVWEVGWVVVVVGLVKGCRLLIKDLIEVRDMVVDVSGDGLMLFVEDVVNVVGVKMMECE